MTYETLYPINESDLTTMLCFRTTGNLEASKQPYEA